MITFLKKYLQINTAQPSPRYNQAIAFFTQQAQKDGFETSEIQLPSGFKVLVVTMRGTDETLPALALNHHMDVVPAMDEKKWTFPPFSGHVEKNMIYGRGAQDMKSVGVAHYFALKKLKETGKQLKRTVHIILVPEEEVGGAQGAGQLVETEDFKKLNIGFVLDEALPSGQKEALLLKVSERKPIQIEFVCKGEMFHGSRLKSNNVVNQLILFVARLAQLQEEQKKRAEGTDPGLLLSLNVTSLLAGKKEASLNVVPGEARATVDIRVPPTMKKQTVLDMIEQELKDFPDITYSIKAQAREREFNQDFKTPFFNGVKKAIETCGLTAQPYFAEIASDLRFYQEKGIEGFGLSPFTIQANLHGFDECISVGDMELGRDVFFNVLVDFCV